MKLYLGCAEPPFHEQHTKVMGNPDEWVWVDKYIDHPKVEKWDAMSLPVANETVDKIYASHLLEHLPHVKVSEVLKHWHSKLANHGQILLNVPDMFWLARQVVKYCKDEQLNGYYTNWEGEHGLQSILYGSQSHDGEYHKSGYTSKSLYLLLDDAGFRNISINSTYDAHDMGVLIAEATK